MIRLQSDSETLGIVQQRLTRQWPSIQFGGNLRLGRLEIELNRETADFVIALIDEVRKCRHKNIEVEVDDRQASQSSITREFLNGYFRRH